MVGSPPRRVFLAQEEEEGRENDGHDVEIQHGEPGREPQVSVGDIARLEVEGGQAESHLLDAHPVRAGRHVDLVEDVGFSGGKNTEQFLAL